MSPSFVNCFLDEVGSSVYITSVNHYGLIFKLHFFLRKNVYSSLIISFTFRHQFFTANKQINKNTMTVCQGLLRGSWKLLRGFCHVRGRAAAQLRGNIEHNFCRIKCQTSTIITIVTIIICIWFYWKLKCAMLSVACGISPTEIQSLQLTLTSDFLSPYFCVSLRCLFSLSIPYCMYVERFTGSMHMRQRFCS